MAGLEQMLHCECGATRIAPPGLRTVSCVQCGREMHAPLPPTVDAPSTAILTLGALLSQLVAGLVIVLAGTWSVMHRVAAPEVITAAGIALVSVLAAGLAYGGRVIPLLVAGAIDAVIAGVSLSHTGVLAELDSNVSNLLDPQHLALGHGVAAGLAALLCAAAIPQAHRYTRWQDAQIERAIAAKRL
jgi:hypothetical protein